MERIMRQYRAKSGKMQWMPSLEEVRKADEESAGFCLACGEHVEGVEPDAAKYTCEACGAAKVYGAIELVLRGLAY